MLGINTSFYIHSSILTQLFKKVFYQSLKSGLTKRKTICIVIDEFKDQFEKSSLFRCQLTLYFSIKFAFLRPSRPRKAAWILMIIRNLFRYLSLIGSLPSSVSIKVAWSAGPPDGGAAPFEAIF